MITVTVEASKTYDVKIGSHLLCTIGAEAAALGKAKSVAVISDTNVWPLYGQTVRNNLEASGFSVCCHILPAGEASKNGTQYLEILNFLAGSGLTRSDLIVSLGGGVIGDIAGFAASTYLRGIRYIQVPTTLLAAVDSSVGGKTAIDLPGGKNLCGAFWQPSLVLCDTDTLTTLPEDIFRDGCAEVIKYAILFDRPLFDELQRDGLSFNRERVIARCVAHKRDVVMRDERDTGERMLLNLGHTVGHGVEARSNFTISHGKAVAIGISIICRATGCADTGEILSCLTRFGLPTSTVLPADDICRYMLSDKKRDADFVNLIVADRIGACQIRPTRIDSLKKLMEEGL